MKAIEQLKNICNENFYPTKGYYNSLWEHIEYINISDEILKKYHDIFINSFNLIKEELEKTKKFKITITSTKRISKIHIYHKNKFFKLFFRFDLDNRVTSTHAGSIEAATQYKYKPVENKYGPWLYTSCPNLLRFNFRYDELYLIKDDLIINMFNDCLIALIDFENRPEKEYIDEESMKIAFNNIRNKFEKHNNLKYYLNKYS